MGVFQAHVSLLFPVGAGGGTNTWSLRTVGAVPTGAEITSLMEIVRAWYEDVSNIVPTTYVASWDGSVSERANPAPAFLESGTPWSVAGTAPGTYTGAPSMACVTWRTSLASRRGRGRTFHGPLAASAIEGNGTLTSGAMTSLRDANAVLLAASEAATGLGALGVFSEADQVVRDFVGSTVTDQVAVLRSRRG